MGQPKSDDPRTCVLRDVRYRSSEHAEVVAAAPGADTERDDELARLQRLLGMTGLAKAAENIDDSKEAKKEEAKEEAPVDLEVEEKKKG